MEYHGQFVVTRWVKVAPVDLRLLGDCLEMLVKNGEDHFSAGTAAPPPPVRAPLPNYLSRL